MLKYAVNCFSVMFSFLYIVLGFQIVFVQLSIILWRNRTHEQIVQSVSGKLIWFEEKYTCWEKTNTVLKGTYLFRSPVQLIPDLISDWQLWRIMMIFAPSLRMLKEREPFFQRFLILPFLRILILWLGSLQPKMCTTVSLLQRYSSYPFILTCMEEVNAT